MFLTILGEKVIPLQSKLKLKSLFLFCTLPQTQIISEVLMQSIDLCWLSGLLRSSSVNWTFYWQNKDNCIPLMLSLIHIKGRVLIFTVVSLKRVDYWKYWNTSEDMHRSRLVDPYMGPVFHYQPGAFGQKVDWLISLTDESALMGCLTSQCYWWNWLR